MQRIPSSSAGPLGCCCSNSSGCEMLRILKDAVLAPVLRSWTVQSPIRSFEQLVQSLSAGCCNARSASGCARPSRAHITLRSRFERPVVLPLVVLSLVPYAIESIQRMFKPKRMFKPDLRSPIHQDPSPLGVKPPCKQPR